MLSLSLHIVKFVSPRCHREPFHSNPHTPQLCPALPPPAYPSLRCFRAAIHRSPYPACYPQPLMQHSSFKPLCSYFIPALVVSPFPSSMSSRSLLHTPQLSFLLLPLLPLSSISSCPSTASAPHANLQAANKNKTHVDFFFELVCGSVLVYFYFHYEYMRWFSFRLVNG